MDTCTTMGCHSLRLQQWYYHLGENDDIQVVGQASTCRCNVTKPVYANHSNLILRDLSLEPSTDLEGLW